MKASAIPTVQIDNDRTCVTLWQFEPGAETGYHKHAYDYVIVPQSTGQLKIIGPDGSETFAELKAGECYFRNAGVEHNVINANETPFAFIEVEMK